MEKPETQPELYSDQEVQAGIKELFSHEKFLAGMQAFLPTEMYQYIFSVKEEVKSIYDFQSKIIYPFLKMIQKNCISELTVSGFENLNAEDKYLFISNHRDIVLDSAFLNMLLFENKISTSQIAIGSNLMQTRISEILFRINKSFVVQRTGTPRELYAHSVELSKYIQKLISEKKDSVWIAQREGRAKDGNDKTQQGLLKMISLSGGKNLKEHFQNLKIVPVSISYELDPTALLKTQEYLKKQADPDFKKSFQTDVNYMLLGIKGEKGKVHFSFGKPLLEELEILETAKNNKQQLEFLTHILDRSIHLNYQLNPINFVAHDLLFLGEKKEGNYSEKEWNQYSEFFQKQINQLPQEEQAVGKKYLLGIYANPVVNSKQ